MVPSSTGERRDAWSATHALGPRVGTGHGLSHLTSPGLDQPTIWPVEGAVGVERQLGGHHDERVVDGDGLLRLPPD